MIWKYRKYKSTRVLLLKTVPGMGISRRIVSEDCIARGPLVYG